MAYGTAFVPPLKHWICHIMQKSASFSISVVLSAAVPFFPRIREPDIFLVYTEAKKNEKKLHFFGHFQTISCAVLYMR